MDKTLIVARMRPGSEQDIAAVFAASDSTELPRRIGVQSRTLFRFHDLYMHLIEAEQSLSATVDATREDPLFREVSKNLSPFVSAYDPDTWRMPSDAMATAFYHWHSQELPAAEHGVEDTGQGLFLVGGGRPRPPCHEAVRADKDGTVRVRAVQLCPVGAILGRQIVLRAVTHAVAGERDAVPSRSQPGRVPCSAVATGEQYRRPLVQVQR